MEQTHRSAGEAVGLPRALILRRTSSKLRRASRGARGDSSVARRARRLRLASAVTVFAWTAASCSAATHTAPPAEPTELIEVPAGAFLMGSDQGPMNTRPARRVFLDAYAIERTEVPAAAFLQYLHFIGGGPSAPALDPSLPAVGVPWRQADGYCRSIGRRLPTEAEWEKAARGTDGRHYPWGSDWDPRKANTAEGGPGEPTESGTYPDAASPYGLLDMSGNVAEWVADYFEADYYRVAPASNPLGPIEVLDHGLRGGSWDSPPSQATTFFRDSSHSATANLRVGFRCAAASSTDERASSKALRTVKMKGRTRLPCLDR